MNRISTFVRGAARAAAALAAAIVGGSKAPPATRQRPAGGIPFQGRPKRGNRRGRARWDFQR